MARTLTKRELEVALLAVEGLSQRKIAEKLGTTRNTVTRQITNIYYKLDIQPHAGGRYDCRIQLANKLAAGSGSMVATLKELKQQLDDVKAERDGYRVENRRLREALGQ